MFALATMQTSVCDKAHLLRVPTPQHLNHETIVVARIVARIDTFEPVPVIDNYLFERPRSAQA